MIYIQKYSHETLLGRSNDNEMDGLCSALEGNEKLHEKFRLGKGGVRLWFPGL